MSPRITKTLLTAGILAAIGAAPLTAQEHMGRGHQGNAPQEGMMMHRMMMHQMMEECPMAHGGMMGAQVLLEHADALEFSDDQVARLEVLGERQMELRAQMMEVMETVDGVLTPEQREVLHQQMQAGMGPMMQGMMDRDGMPERMQGMMDRDGMPERMQGMRGAHAMGCPMMGPMMGGTNGEHPPSGHPDEG